MDARGLLGVLAVVLLTSVAASTLGAPPGPPTTRHLTLTVEEVACPAPRADGKTCLAYNGTTPGPTLDVDVGDTLVVRLVNRATAAVSWHVHGMALATEMDGMAAHAGTRFADSYAPPGGEFTYTVRAAHAGTWHYHDHVLGQDGAEGVSRGLFGSIFVRADAEPRPDAALDLHMLDAGANAGRGLDADVAVGSDVDVAVVGLQDRVWTVTLRAPDGSLVGSTVVGPGVSDRLRIEDAVAGDHTWTAKWLFVTHAGKVTVR